MKIAMVGHKHIPSREGGVEIVVEELATRMVKKGHNVTCYNRKSKHVLDKKQKIEKVNDYKGIKIKSVPTIDVKGLAALSSSFFATLSILFSKFDVVHYHAEGPCLWLWLLRKTKKKIIVTIHGLDWQRAKWGGIATKTIKFGEKQAVENADCIIVLSENVGDYFKKKYQRETIFIPNGVTKPVLRNCNIITNKYKLKKNDYILFLGRIVPEKGIHYLIDAYQKIKTDKKLVIAGSASDTDEYFNNLRKRTKNNSNIIFTGFVQGDELDELYSNAYLYCLPSDLEGMPLSLLEAMSYGNCCLTSDIDECAQIIQNMGMLFKKSDINDLQCKLAKLIENPNLVENYKTEAQKYILKSYDWEKVVEKTLKLYEE